MVCYKQKSVEFMGKQSDKEIGANELMAFCKANPILAAKTISTKINCCTLHPVSPIVS